MVAKERSGETGRSVSGRGESGQSSVEWIGLVLFVSGVFVALSVGGVTPSPAAVVHSIHRGILCAVAYGGSCPEGASIDHYGAEVAALVRRFEPEIAFRSELLGMPVDFRTCRSPGCAEPPEGERLVGSIAGARATLFTRVIDCRDGGVEGDECGGSAEGNLYIHYWAYFPESSTFRGVPVLEGRGHHPHDWESTQVRIGPDGTVSQRASSHAGYNHSRSIGNWPSDAGLDLPAGVDRLLGRDSPGGWGPWTGRWLVEGGSHAGNVGDPASDLRHPIALPKGRTRLVPLEAVRHDPLVRPARFEPITPPWLKRVWSDPEATGTG
jgi:hypothetical protein